MLLPTRYTPYAPPFHNKSTDVDSLRTDYREVHEHPPIPTKRSNLTFHELSGLDALHPVLTRSSLTISPQAQDPNLAIPGSLFRGLPLESTQNIFELPTSEAPSKGFDNKADVCGRMRISEPTSSDVKLVEQYLQKVTEPIKLDLTMHTQLLSASQEVLQASEEVLSHLARQSHRWRHIHFTLFGNAQSPSFSDLCQSGIQLPHLQILDLSTRWSDDMNQRFLHFILTSSPNIQVLRLLLSESTDAYALTKIPGPSGERLTSNVSKRAPIPNLKDVYLLNLPQSELKDTLRVLPNLLHLGIGHHLPYKATLEQPSSELVIHEHLVSLRCGVSNRNTVNYLERMTLKSLKELHICRVDPGFGNSLLKNFLARSGCHLTMLHLDGQEDKLIEVLTEVETELSELQICRLSTEWTPNQLTNATLEVFAPKADGTIPFPSLVNLSLLHCKIEDGLISGFLEERYVPGARANIEVVEVRTECWSHVNDVKCFDKAIQEGKLKKYSLIFPVNHEGALYIEES